MIMVDPRHYAAVLLDATRERGDARSVVDALCVFLQKQKKSYLLPRILKEYETLLRKKGMLPEIKMWSTAALSKALTEKVLAVASAPSHTAVRAIIEPALHGGVRVQYNHALYDLSLRRTLKRLTAHLTRA